MVKCNICDKEFEHGTQLGGHITNAHNKKAIIKSAKSRTLKKIFIKKECERCGKEFEVERRIHKNGLEYINKKEKRFCCRNCANVRIHTEETKLKIKKSNSNELGSSWKGGKSKKKKCNCGNIMYAHSKMCINCWHKKIKQPYNKRSYKYQCRFKFNIFDYPEVFDLELIKKYGLYKPINYHTPNLNGVSFDHMYSIDEGLKNNVNPQIVSHPANCKLMLQIENDKKNSVSSITLEELIEKIKNWDAIVSKK